MPAIQSTTRVLAMLEAVIADGGRSSVSAVARQTGVPVATAHRQVATLVAEGYLARTTRGAHIAGPRLLTLLHQVDEKQLVVTAAAPFIADLAAELGTIAQLGTLENDMVTYRLKAGSGANALFTKVGMQLEAYCSAIGKVLLASLSDAEQQAYLATGPFPALTDRTLTAPNDLARELEKVRQQGFATDDAEIARGLICMAVPIRGVRGQVVAAISISRSSACWQDRERDRYSQALLRAAGQIEQSTFGGMGSLAGQASGS
ncbi:IclR family transcriptional regulator [Sphingomonas turrisvirgatae]|uniref:IclR family transcriptional regulator n=1 Tax=Sphingomonas turrisvirgatae TaxID=1888892 RepID=UPI001F4ECE9C|nr:IclR family transcriptional regulator [Sphingomonas turrisvirgatae]